MLCIFLAPVAPPPPSILTPHPISCYKSYLTFIARCRARYPSTKAKPPRSRPVEFPTRLHRARPSDRRSPQSRTAPRPSCPTSSMGSHEDDGLDRGGLWQGAPSRARWPRTSREERRRLESPPPCPRPRPRPRDASRSLLLRWQRRGGGCVRRLGGGYRGSALRRDACRRPAVSLVAASRGRSALACDPARALSAGFYAPRDAAMITNFR